MPFHLPGGSEWIIILLVILLIFGPKNLPKLGSAMGQFVKNLKAGRRGEDLDEDEDLEESPPPPRSDSAAKG
ncbi:hypothetical protein AMJ85_09400 [candidate division BRC1 bacterium SM23_51]|nr:MAG: hypothetical protein AMJ85_09400 [candidate division BRC1 bacterium SM23_51]